MTNNKVLIINCVYGFGSTGVIVKNIKNSLCSNGWDCQILYSRGIESKENNVTKIAAENIFKVQSFFSRITGLTYGCSPISTHRIVRYILKHKPDIVNLHCINANTVNVIELLNFLKTKKIPTVITLHAEFLYTGGCAHAKNCNRWLHGCEECPQLLSTKINKKIIWPSLDKTSGYWKGLYKVYRDFKNLRVTCVSPWLKSRASRSPFFSDKPIYVTFNGVNTKIFHPKLNSSLRGKLKINGDTKIFVHPTPNFKDPLKGGQYVINFANELLKRNSSAIVLIIGFSGDPSILPTNTIGLPRTINQEQLAEYYSIADATVIASERETFSMVTAESLCCGTPVIGFEAGGPESICTLGHVEFVKYGDINSLVDAALNIEKTADISNKYSSIFSIESTISSYESIFRESINQT